MARVSLWEGPACPLPGQAGGLLTTPEPPGFLCGRKRRLGLLSGDSQEEDSEKFIDRAQTMCQAPSGPGDTWRAQEGRPGGRTKPGLCRPQWRGWS